MKQRIEEIELEIVELELRIADVRKGSNQEDYLNKKLEKLDIERKLLEMNYGFL